MLSGCEIRQEDQLFIFVIAGVSGKKNMPLIDMRHIQG